MKYFNRKGQAALEFMMTYGWAILVVLAAIGALSYFGILNPAKFTPDTCLASSGFACPGKPILNSTSVIFSLVNGQGYTITLDNTTANLTVTPFTCTIRHICAQGDTTCTAGVRAIGDGSGATIRFAGCDFSNLQVVKGEAQFKYVNDQSRLTETLIVSVTGKAIK